MPPKGRRRDPHHRPHQSRPRPSRDPDQVPLIPELRAALRSDTPVDLLNLVSAIMVSVEPKLNPTSDTTLRSISQAFMNSPWAETTAALTVIRSLTTDAELREQIEAELAQRRHPLPAWLARLDEARLEPDVFFLTHPQGDGDDFLLGLVTATGDELTALIYVDHNLGSIVKDAFLIPAPLEDVIIKMGTTLDGDQSLTKTDPANARSAVEMAIAKGRLDPEATSESWPQCRAAVEWMVRMLPEGGHAPEAPEWSDEQAAALMNEFLDSDLATAIDGDATPLLAGLLIAYGRTFGTRDPLTWSPVTVEMVMGWFASSAPLAAEALLQLPDVLRAFIRFADAKKGVRAGLTEETVAAVAQWVPLFKNEIQLRDSQAKLDLVELWQQGDAAPAMVAPIFLAGLAEAVGGEQALRDLDDAPLPDEELDWEGIAEDIRPAVEQMATLLDRFADAAMDVEHRTAMRRLLARAVRSNPAVVRRTKKHERTAAAVAWLICVANESVGPYSGLLKVKDLAVYFGLEGVATDKADTLLKAIGVDPRWGDGTVRLGTPDLLVAARRRELIAQRDRWEAALGE